MKGRPVSVRGNFRIHVQETIVSTYRKRTFPFGGTCRVTWLCVCRDFEKIDDDISDSGSLFVFVPIRLISNIGRICINMTQD